MMIPSHWYLSIQQQIIDSITLRSDTACGVMCGVMAIVCKKL
jgi:hypothetical protein